jgi:hypothetical protein
MNLCQPMVQNMSQANAQALRDILSDDSGVIRKYQNGLFEYILYYYLNEIFASSVEFSVDEGSFENLYQIFQHLGAKKIRYEFKLKYEGKLYSEKNIRQVKWVEELFILKVVLLKYIGQTEQIKKCDNPTFFLQSYTHYLKSKRKTVIVLELLRFFRIISVYKEFQEKIDPQFVKELLRVCEIFKRCDIVHNEVFQILQNLSSFVQKSAEAFEFVCDFAL